MPQSEPGWWTEGWCSVHRRVEDPFPAHPHRVCTECGHVYLTGFDVVQAYTDNVSATVPDPVAFCPWCLSLW